ncbi:response regulator [Candidatus Albibeggiatoa sp. nov. NOAA]|uniref:response regulator n=1 Tax=Candidatus Albibeggiatoa sp. nov. NOAA TaxID=3162724 RepID=UPI0032F840CD|nr:response regulator [Thiotrichaceae bacterium]
MKIKQSTINFVMSVTFLSMAVLLGSSIYYLKQASMKYKHAVTKQAEFKQLGIDLANASNYLTAEAQKFSVTANIEHLNNFWNEVHVTRTRDNILKRLKILQASQQEFDLLDLAKNNSDALVATETRSMRLVLDVLGYQEAEMPPPIAAWKLSPEDKALSNDDKMRVAREIMFDDKYHQDKNMIMTPIAEFQKLSNDNANAALKIAKHDAQHAEIILFIIAILIPVGMGVILWIFRSKVNLPISHYTEILHQHETENNQEKRLNLEPAGTFELITLAKAFNQQINTNRQLIEESHQVSQELSEQNWQKTGQTQLNEKLRGEQNIYDLAKNIIDFVTSYSQSELGSFYLYQTGETPYLERIASYGCVIPSHFPNQFVLGEGLVGQAALEQRILVRQPQVEELQSLLQSSFCEITPRYIMFLPFFYEQQLKGVVEIATCRAFTEKQQEFLEQSMTSIGIAISGAESRQKMQALLDQSQAQSQQLTLQQQELQVINEELQKQQEELQTANEELQTQQEELRQANEELEIRSRDLIQQKEAIREKNATLERIQQEVEQKAKELELASKYKSEFLANMSHELRTPLNAILVLGQMLAENDDGNLSEEQVDFAQTIHSAGSDLLNLINEILDLSKIEAGKIEIHVEPFSLPALIHDSIEGKFKALATKKKITFLVEFEQESQFDAELYSDPHRIKQIINNLLSNAVKFTDQGTVILTLRYANEQEFPTMQPNQQYVAISVSDTGIGIPSAKQHKVFEAFRQADSKTTRKYGGTGLGLSISKRLAQLLGGDIYLDSQEGQGSTFTVLLRAQLSEPTKAEISTPTHQPNYTDDRANLNEEDKVLLLVEQNSDFSQTLVDLIHQHSLKCIVANDGKAGLNLALMYQPMTIMLDMNLPIIDNWLMVNKLQQHVDTKQIPVNLLFSYADPKLNLIQLANSESLAQMIEAQTTVLITTDNEACQQEISTLLNHNNLHFATEYQHTLQLLAEKTIGCLVIDIDCKQGEALSLLELIGQNIRPSLIVLYARRELSLIEQHFLQHCEICLLETSNEDEAQLLSQAQSALQQIDQNLLVSDHVNGLVNYDKTSSLKGKKVLLVDDDVRNTHALELFLNKREMQVEIAHHGKEALYVLNQHQDTDIILMDIMMPEMDGYETIRQIRLQHHFKTLPIIALTAKAMKGDRSKCIEAGASDYLTKPIDTEKLLSLMRVWLYQ